MSTEKTILVVEPHAVGHHGPYLEWMVESLIKVDCRVIVQTLEQSTIHPSLRKLRSLPVNILEMSAVPEAMPFRVGGNISPLIRREAFYWRRFKAWYAYAKSICGSIDLVHMPYLDYCLYAIGIFGSPFGNTAWSGLSMKPSFHYQEMKVIAPKPELAWAKKYLFFRMLKNRYLRAIFTLDEPLYEYCIGRNRADIKDKIVFMPEPADALGYFDQGASKRTLGLPLGRKFVLVYGSLTYRKGISRLVASFSSEAFPDNVDAVLAGQLDEETRSFLATDECRKLIDGGRIIIHDEFIEPWKEGLLLSATDMIWLGYLNHYNSSGVLVQAAQYAKPIIACRDGVIGWQSRRHDIGIVIEVGDESSIINAIKALAENGDLAKKLGQNGADAYADHTKDNAMKILSKNIGADTLKG